MAILKEDYDFAKAELAKLQKKYPILGKEIKPLAVRVRDVGGSQNQLNSGDFRIS